MVMCKLVPSHVVVIHSKRSCVYWMEFTRKQQAKSFVLSVRQQEAKPHASGACEQVHYVERLLAGEAPHRTRLYKCIDGHCLHSGKVARCFEKTCTVRHRSSKAKLRPGIGTKVSKYRELMVWPI